MLANKQQIIDLETRFWQSMKDKDVDTAKSLIAKEGLVTGPMGTMTMDPDKYAQMTRDGQWTLQNFKMDKVEVVQPNSDSAIIAYEVRQTGDMKGQPMDLRCADSSVWVKEGGDWKCALHTETILEDANARQREPA
ncbi:MAG TPA: nuclear transport factor 2 family protein [Sphingomicrobium sp.]|jgi:hypothetical protein|nr:nuclear transport factor 2 family protein [Sphingomicrobium sp.]